MAMVTVGGTQKPGRRNPATYRLCHLPWHRRIAGIDASSSGEQGGDHCPPRLHAGAWCFARHGVGVNNCLFLPQFSCLFWGSPQALKAPIAGDLCRYLKMTVFLKHQHLHRHSKSYIGYCLFIQMFWLSTYYMPVTGDSTVSEKKLSAQMETRR